jgi:hypothetical protein
MDWLSGGVGVNLGLAVANGKNNEWIGVAFHISIAVALIAYRHQSHAQSDTTEER